MHRRTHRMAAVTAAAALLITGCSAGTVEHATVPASAEIPALPPAEGVVSTYAVQAPGPLDRGVLSADVLLVAARPLPSTLPSRVEARPGVRTSLPLSVASVALAGRSVTIGAVDPRAYRRFTPRRSAEAEAVWDRVAAGELAMRSDLAEAMRQPLGADITLGTREGTMALRVGAFATLTPGIDAVVNHRRGAALGMVERNALLVSVRGDVDEAVRRVEGLLPRWVSAHPLVETPTGVQTAFLTGGSLADAVGSFAYRYSADGTVEPDAAWVTANIRTETVPILGAVTCHRVLLPQLRAALQEVVDAGLASAIDPSDYGGCYVPRFIAHDVSKGLSLHTWGIAVDLNVQGNLRGTVGAIDRRVVDIFRRWGFAWGGDWAYTDPMHFELAALVTPG